MVIGIIGTPDSGKSILRRVFEGMGYESFILNPKDSFEEKVFPYLCKSKQQVVDSLHKVEDIEKFIFNKNGVLVYVDFEAQNTFSLEDKYIRWAKKNKYNFLSREMHKEFVELNKHYSKFSGLSKVHINNVFCISELAKLKDLNGFRLGGYDLEKILKSVLKK